MDSAATAPRLVSDRETIRLVIPASFARALDSVAHGFTPFRRRDFSEQVISFLAPDSASAKPASPFAVVDDFDGDGHPDVALYGVRSTGAALVAVLAGANGVTAVIVDSTPGAPPSPGSLEEFVKSTAAGKIELPDYDAPTKDGEPPKRIPLVLRNPGFQLVWLGKGATLYYYDGKRFRQVTSSD